MMGTEKTATVLQHDDGRGNHLDAGAETKTTDSVAIAWDNTDDFWKSCAMSAVTYLAEVGQPFEAFDVTELGVPDPDHPARWGALFRAMATAGVITTCGYTESRRPSRHGSVCRLWIGNANRNADRIPKDE